MSEGIVINYQRISVHTTESWLKHTDQYQTEVESSLGPINGCSIESWGS